MPAARTLKVLAPYIGLIASPKRAESIRGYLKLRGMSKDDLDARLHAPAGLDLGARRGDEIALSILAEIVQIRRASERFDWPSAESEASTTAVDTALDPVCGMQVVVEGARHSTEHEGTTYYFCCGGCVAAFEAAPAEYLQSRVR